MVEWAKAEIEGGSTGATLVGLGRGGGVPTSHILESAASSTLHKVLQNSFKSLLNIKDRVAGPGSAARKPPPIMSRILVPVVWREWEFANGSGCKQWAGGWILYGTAQ